MTSQVESTAGFEELLAYVRDERGFDFTGYKRPSLTRRIAKRMGDVKIDDFESYRAYLEQHPAEFASLFDTILINVTSFFRDGTTWEYIRREIVPRIIDGVSPTDTIRIWTTGCSTGEEAFTVAMVFADYMGDDEFTRRVKIYATDVDDHALGIGRQALYTASQLEPVPEQFRGRFFEQVGEMFGFRADMRRCVIFGRHDLVQDPPISRIDFLVSRNTLMYFDSDTQQRVLRNFHFALRENAVLFLGKSEVLVARSPLFTPLELRKRVFIKIGGGGTRDLTVPRPPSTVVPPRPELSAEETLQTAAFDSGPVAQVVVDRVGKVTAANKQARVQFGLAQRDIGTLLQDIELSYRPLELRSRIEQVYGDGHAVSIREVEWHTGNDVRYVDVHVHPLTSRGGDLVGVTVSYTDVTRYRGLQEALQETRREVETAYEELQSTVEELETTNEELQSTNEELETMNEELQSTNEELQAMNDDMRERGEELDQVNSLLECILTSLRSAVIVVDTELKILVWNRGAEDLWGLHEQEVRGKHFLGLDIGLPVEQLKQPIRSCLTGGKQRERIDLKLDAINRRGRPVSVQVSICPLMTLSQKIHGVVLLTEAEGESAGNGANGQGATKANLTKVED